MDIVFVAANFFAFGMGYWAYCDALALRRQRRYHDSTSTTVRKLDINVEAKNIDSNQFTQFLKQTCPGLKKLEVSGENQQFQQDKKLARPIYHNNVVKTAKLWLDYKITNGSSIEKQVYDGMSVSKFIDRLITKRPMVFMGAGDYTRLGPGITISITTEGQTKTFGPGDSFNKSTLDFKVIGTEEDPCLLKHFLSYDEMQWSSMLGISSKSFVRNYGDRNNGLAQIKGGRTDRSKIEETAIVVGQVGARFERGFQDDLNEWELMVWDSARDSEWHKEKCRIFAQLYGVDPSVMLNKPQSNPRCPVKGNLQFNEPVFVARCTKLMETFLLEANQRGKEDNTIVYAVTVGLGLGVWSADIGDRGLAPRHPGYLNALFIKASMEALKNLVGCLPYVKTLEFQWSSFHAGLKWGNANGVFGQTMHLDGNHEAPFNYLNGNLVFTPDGSARCGKPLSKLTGKYAGHLMVINYAWDGVSFPGNEFFEYNGNNPDTLAASGDPAMACATNMWKHQNFFLNRENLTGAKTMMYAKDVRPRTLGEMGL